MSQDVMSRFGSFSSADGQKQAASISSLNQPQFKMVVYMPKKFDDVQSIAACLMDKSGVLIYFENIEGSLKCRIVDYMNGVSYALGAQAEKLSDNIVMYVPENAEIEIASFKKADDTVSKWF